MRKQAKEQERKVVVEIRSSRRKAATLDTWRYWEIVGELQFMGATRVQAVDAAKWCVHAEPGAFMRIFLTETEEIELEVKEW